MDKITENELESLRTPQVATNLNPVVSEGNTPTNKNFNLLASITEDLYNEETKSRVRYRSGKNSCAKSQNTDKGSNPGVEMRFFKRDDEDIYMKVDHR